MTNLMAQTVAAGTVAAFGPPPSRPSLPPALSSALSDRSYVFNGSGEWTASYGLSYIRQKGLPDEVISTALADLKAAMAPAPKQWVVDRLTVLATMFSVGRHPSAAEDMAIWLLETSRLLMDLPHDILAQAIDDAVRTRGHGFMPSVGEIRSLAEPMLEERRKQIVRLMTMEIAAGESTNEEEMPGPGPGHVDHRSKH